MKKEKSCGAVVYKIEDGKRLYLIEKMQLGHYSIPKGHVEGSESEVETATREIKEETNLEVIIDTNFRKTTTYSPSKDVIKDVVFFVSRVIGGIPHNQEIEVNKILFLPFAEAYDILTFASDKEVLEAAEIYLSN